MTAAVRYPAGILATCCIPWTEDWQFDEDRFRCHVRQQISDGFRDLYIFGTAGEGYAVTDKQFDEITDVFLDEARAGSGRAMVGLISLSLATVIERIDRARAKGARRFQLSFPSWGRLNDAEVARFFAETCGRFPDCDFLHYNLARAGRVLNGIEYGELSAKHANLVATKSSTTDEGRLRELFQRAPDLRHFITELGFAKASLMGECGFLVSIASVNPRLATRYFEAGAERDRETLGKMFGELEELISDLLSAVGSSVHMDAAFDKIFCRVRDPGFPLRLLPPYQAISHTDFAVVVDQLRENHPKWLA